MEKLLNVLDQCAPLMDSILDFVRVVDLNCKIVFINEAMRKEFGESIGKPCHEGLGVGKACKDCVVKQLKIPGKKEVTLERIIRDKCYSVKASPIKDEAGNLIGAIEVFRDITKENKLKTELLAINKKMLVDLSMARRLQWSMFQKAPLQVEGYRFSVGFFPCEAVGGDALDAILLKNGTVLLYVADVCGHGVRAAMLTVFVTQQIAMLAKQEPVSLRGILSGLEEAFLEIDAGDETYITLFMVMLDPKTGKITYTNAGHSVTPLLKTNGEVHALFAPGMPISKWGGTPGSEEKEAYLFEGDRLLLFTDGISDRKAGDDSLESLQQSFGEEPFYGEKWVEQLKSASNRNEKDDLIALLCERVNK